MEGSRSGSVEKEWLIDWQVRMFVCDSCGEMIVGRRGEKWKMLCCRANEHMFYFASIFFSGLGNMIYIC